ncbi:MAG: S-layer homology domain-containing protein [Clostridia bacterium]|nr:S-layer homology domain-containing protein [Clostridia bacterium]
MKKFYPLRLLLLLFFTLSISLASISASVDSAFQAESSKILLGLGIIDNSKTGSTLLKKKIIKHEYISLVVKMLSLDEEKDTENIQLPYKDVDKTHKAYNNIKIAYKYGILSGDEGSTLLPNGYISYSGALGMVLNGLGYSGMIKDMSPEDVIKTATDLGVTEKASISASKQISYGEAYVIVNNSLLVDFYTQNNSSN